MCTKRELQSLAGHFSHACKVVQSGRCFLRGMFERISRFRLHGHKIRLNTAIRADVELCRCFGKSTLSYLQMLSSGQMLQGRGVVGQCERTIGFR